MIPMHKFCFRPYYQTGDDSVISAVCLYDFLPALLLRRRRNARVRNE